MRRNGSRGAKPFVRGRGWAYYAAAGCAACKVGLKLALQYDGGYIWGVKISRPPDRLENSFWPGALGLLAVVVVVFKPVLGFDFVRWDDDINITQNSLLTAPWSWSLVTQLFDSDQTLRFKPLHWLCFRFLHAVFGFDPAGWHGFNLALHGVATVLFYWVLRRVFNFLCLRLAAWAALAGAAVWALHPLRSEVVAWSTASPYSLTAVMLLASFACYLEAVLRPAPARGWLVWSWGGAVLAYASYPVGATYGLWLMVTDRWLLPAKAGQLRDPVWWTKHALFLVPSAITVALTLWSRITSPGIFTTAPSVESVGVLSRVEMALASLSYILRVVVWPVDLTPNKPPLAPGGAVAFEVAGMALFAMTGLIFCWRVRWSKRAWATVGFGFVTLALPCLGWTERPAWPVDRYSYLVHLVVIGGAAGAFFHWAAAGRARLIGFCLGLAVFVLLGALTARRQAMIWKDNTALFTHMERHSQFAASPRQQGHIYYLWGSAEVVAGHPDRAAELFNRAQQVYLNAIKAAVAREDFHEALALSTHLEHNFALVPVMRRERGAWLLRLGRKPEARKELQRAQPGLPGDARLAALMEEAQ